MAAAAEVSDEDLARNLFDVLSNVPETMLAGSSGGGDASEWRSWCGAAEVGVQEATLFHVLSKPVPETLLAGERRERGSMVLLRLMYGG